MRIESCDYITSTGFAACLSKDSQFSTVILLEHSVQRRIYLVRYFSECLRIRLELLGVAVHYYQPSLIVLNPFLISLVQTCELVDAYSLLALTSSLANLIHQIRYRGADVYHEVRQLHESHHRIEEIRIVVEVAV